MVVAASGGWRVWVRRCRTCGVDDVRAAYGQPALLDERPWWCPACGSTQWRAVCLELPATAASLRCPYREGRA